MAAKKASKKVVAVNVAQRNTPAPRNSTTIVVHERERVATLSGSVGFALANTFTLNPGLPASFPWLSVIANQFEKYRMSKVVYRFRPSKGSSSPGIVVLAFEPDATDLPPSSALEIAQGLRYADGPVWSDLELLVPMKFEGFVRNSAIANSDVRLSDAGKVYVAVEGCADTTICGYIEAEYTIELMMKNAGGSGGRSTNRQVAELTGFYSGVTGVNMPVTLGLDGIGLQTTSTSVTLPAASYLVTVMPAGDITTGFSVVPYLNGVAAPTGITPVDGGTTLDLGRIWSRVLTFSSTTIFTLLTQGSTGSASLYIRFELL